MSRRLVRDLTWEEIWDAPNVCAVEETRILFSRAFRDGR